MSPLRRRWNLRGLRGLVNLQAGNSECVVYFLYFKLFFSSKYRPEWWADIDYKDEALRSGKFRGFFYSLKENDHMWFDPKVEDGTSLAGPFGLDSKYHPDITKKGDQVGDLFEFQRKVCLFFVFAAALYYLYKSNKMDLIRLTIWNWPY